MRTILPVLPDKLSHRLIVLDRPHHRGTCAECWAGTMKVQGHLLKKRPITSTSTLCSSIRGLRIIKSCHVEISQEKPGPEGGLEEHIVYPSPSSLASIVSYAPIENVKRRMLIATSHLMRDKEYP